MTRNEMTEWNRKAESGEIQDHLNPAFIFSGIEVELLSKIAKGEINALEHAKRELENRGRDINGKWVGFDQTIKCDSDQGYQTAPEIK